MQNELLVLGALAIVAVGLVATRAGMRSQQGPPRTVRVRVKLERVGTTLTINVDPSLVRMRNVDTLEWELVDGADEMIIERKGDWPFAGDPPTVGKGQNRPAGKVVGTDRDYRYAIRLELGDQTIVVDPDVIIRG
jgi:hypothetical protein